LRVNPYHPTNRSTPERFDEAESFARRACWRTWITTACWLFSGINFLLLPIATCGVVLHMEENLRKGTFDFTIAASICLIPICLAVGGTCAARASIRCRRGHWFGAALNFLCAIAHTLLPWCIEATDSLSKK
tara:strand:+ start:176127 stop:176522 length:396 start_codon:yes stop_codon:yes gene_type:complete